MKITVAIPSYNKELYIERCLSSIIKEKSYIDSILLVDNNSTDKTLEIAKKFGSEVICVKNETNIGMSPNWNKCIDLCKTEWLLIFHADDIMVEGAMKHYKEAVEKYPSAGMIFTNAYAMTEDDYSSKKMTSSTQKEFHKAGLEAMECKPTVCSAVMVKKEAYTALGYFIKESISSDVEMWHRIASKYDVVFINKPTAIYRVNAQSTGQQSLINRSIKAIKADWDTLDQQMASHYPTKELQEKFLRESWGRAPGSYFAVAKANLRARNYYKFLQALYLIVFTYKGFFPLFQIITEIVKRKSTLFLKKIF